MAKKTQKNAGIAAPYLGMRMDPTLRAEIEMWANDRGITLSRAVETLVRTGLQDREVMGRELTEIFNGTENLYLAIGMATAIESTEMITGQSWRDNQVTADAVLAAVVAFLRDAMRSSDAVDLDAAYRQAESDDKKNQLQEAPAYWGYRVTVLKFWYWVKYQKVVPWRSRPITHEFERAHPGVVDEHLAADWLAVRVRDAINYDTATEDDIFVQQAYKAISYNHPFMKKLRKHVNALKDSEIEKSREVLHKLIAEDIDPANLSDEEFADRMGGQSIEFNRATGNVVPIRKKKVA